MRRLTGANGIVRWNERMQLLLSKDRMKIEAMHLDVYINVWCLLWLSPLYSSYSSYTKGKMW